MKPIHILLALSFPAAYCLAARASVSFTGESLRFEPREGLVLRKTFESRMELELVEDSSEVWIDGEQQELESEEHESRILVESKLVFVDEISSAAEGRARELTRTHEELSEDLSFSFTAAGIDDVSETEEGESDLEGAKVSFTWNDEESRYEPSLPEGSEIDEDLLVDLEGDTDLLALLPDGEVEPGDSWSIDLSRWRSIDEPGGDVKIELPSDEGSESAADEENLFYENLEGELGARYEGMVERDGVQLAHVVLEGTLSSAFDVEPDLSELEASGFEGELVQHPSYEIELRGDLYWDVSAGRAADLRIASEVRYTLASDQTSEHEGTKFESKSKQVFEGQNVLEAHFEVGD